MMKSHVSAADDYDKQEKAHNALSGRRDGLKPSFSCSEDNHADITAQTTASQEEDQ